MANRIQLRRGNTSEWTNANPILAQGEVGIDLDQNRIKIGDGSTPWNSLAYERPDDQSSNIPNTLVKRDQSGNFSANAVTAALVGNASTASQLANARQISLTGDVNGANSFDGSQNMTITTTLSTQANLSAGTYTKLTVNERGLVTAGQNPTTLAGYNITDGQLENNFLTALSGLHASSLNGYVVKVNNTTTGSVVREIIGTAGRIQQTGDSTGITNNTIFDLIPTGVSAAYSGASSLYFDAGNTQQSKIFNAPDQESNTSTDTGLRMTVDVWGRITEITEFPIVTAYEGTKAAAYDNAVTYLRYAKITAGGRLYEAGYGGVSAGQGPPSHTDGTKTGGWWDLGVAETPVKGLASFDQEDFDVDSTGHVTIADKAIDNTQLQNPIFGFSDGNTLETFALDAEQTASTGYRGLNYLNYVKVNNTNGNPLFAASNAFNSGSGGIDINVNTDNSGDIYLDAAGGGQLIQRNNGSLTVEVNTTTANAETLQFNAFNSGAGSGTIAAEAKSLISLSVQAAGAAGGTTDGKILIEDFRAYDNYLATLSPTLNLDPGDSGDNTGTVRIWGDLQVDGVTTTVNSTVMTVDDPIITLGGDTAPTTDDNKDRGIEFRYYDSQARVGFYGWDDSVTRLDGGTGGYSFLYNATNTSETFSGIDAYIKAGALSLTTNTPSSSSTTGTLVVTGGVGVSEDIYIGQNLNVTGTGQFIDQLTVFDTLLVRASNEEFAIQNGSGVDKFTVDTDNGNTLIEGTLNVNGATEYTSTVVISDTTSSLNKDQGALVVEGGVGIEEHLRVGGIIETDSTIIQGAAPGSGSNSIFSDTSFYSDVILVNNGGTHVFRIRDGASTDKFTVTGSSGNTDIQGTLDVNGATTITNTLSVSSDFSINTNKFTVASVSGDTAVAGTLGVTGNTTLNGDLTGNAALLIQGNANLNGSSTTIGNSNTDTLTVPGQVRFTSTDGQSVGNTYSADGAVRISGGVAIDENLAVQNDVFVYGDLNITGNQIINGTTTYNARIDITNTSQASSLGDNNVAFQTDGGGIVRKNFFVGEDFYVYDDGNNRNAFYVDNSNGNVDIYGDLDIRSGNFTVAAASGNTTIAGTLAVAGQTTINDSLFIDAANEVFRIRDGSSNTDRFSVDTDNGNTHIDGTLNIDGAVNMGNQLTLSNNLSIGSPQKFGVNVQTGATSISGTLSVTSNADIDGNLDVAGTTTLNNTLTLVGGSSNLTVGGNAVIAGNLTVNGTTTTVNSTTVSVDDINIELGATASPSDATANGGGLTLKGSTDKTFNWVNSTDSWTSSEHIDINSSKSLKHGTTVIVNPSRQLINLQGITSTGDIDFASSKFTVDGSTGNTVIAGTLTVQNSLTLAAVTASDGTFTGSVSITDNLSVGGTNFQVTAATGNTEINGTLDVDADFAVRTAANQDRFTVASVSGDVVTSGNLAVNGTQITTTHTGVFNLINSGATTVNIGGDAGFINLGSVTNSTVTVNDDLTVTSNLLTNGTATFNNQLAVDDVLVVSDPGTSRLVTIGTTSNAANFVANSSNLTFGLNSVSASTFKGPVALQQSVTIGTTLNVTNGIECETLTSTVASGTAPLTVTSDTLVSNLNADKLDGNQGSYYTNADNLNAGTVPDARLITTGVTASTYGSASAVGQFTVDVKGRLTGAQEVNIQIAQSQVTDLTTDLAAKADSSSLATVATSGAYSDLTGTPSLATVATSGAYSDLTGTPSLATVATTGAYTDLTGLPTLGTAAATASTDYATAAQGALADSALQSETIDLTTLKAEVAASTDFADFQSRIAAL